MINVELALIAIASLTNIWLGSLHMLWTFKGTKFNANKPAVDEAMRQSHPQLTRHMSMWDAWISFNATHSLGAIMLGVFNLALAFCYDHLLLHAYLLQGITIAVCLTYVAIGKRYWFRTPLLGATFALVCYAAPFCWRRRCRGY